MFVLFSKLYYHKPQKTISSHSAPVYGRADSHALANTGDDQFFSIFADLISKTLCVVALICIPLVTSEKAFIQQASIVSLWELSK